jgi:hypothetical protein
MDEFMRGLAFYFQLEAPGLLLAGASAVALLMFIERPKSPAIAASFLGLMGSLLYFLPKDVLISYYPTPVAVFSLAVACGIAADVRALPWVRHGTGAVSCLAVLSLGVAFCLQRPFPTTPVPSVSAAVEAALQGDPIVWADISGGQFVTQHGVYSAKINFTSEANQDRMVDAMAAAGQSQLIVLDTDAMRSTFSRLSQRYDMVPLGRAYDADVYRIESAKAASTQAG